MRCPLKHRELSFERVQDELDTWTFDGCQFNGWRLVLEAKEDLLVFHLQILFSS